MTTDTKLQKLIINKLTTSEYSSINEKDPNQLYLVTDALGFDNTITNCLTHIPQDINLELNNGTLTAKQGSRVWIPYGTTEAYQVGDVDTYGNTVVATSWDGSNFFYAIELQSDTSQNFSRTDTSKRLMFMELNTSLSAAVNIGSGTSPVNDTLYYRTDNNTIGYYMSDGSFVQSSLPLGVCVADGTYMFGSINQVFNGVGYIGSTIFALPGVRGKISDYKNEDGSLKNIDFEIKNVLTHTSTNALNTAHWIITNGSHLDLWDSVNWIGYDEKKNILYNKYTNAQIKYCHVATGLYYGSSSPSNFQPKTTFQSVDRNELKQFELPTGSVIAFAANSTPNGYLICNGAAVNRTTYADLFSVIGTTYGSGDGSTTFNVPNLTDRFIQGSGTAGSVKNAGLPNITGAFSSPKQLNANFNFATTQGAFYSRGQYGESNSIIVPSASTSNHQALGGFDASRSSSIYGNSSTVQPPALTMRYYIKY